jgi:hypothetical protein
MSTILWFQMLSLLICRNCCILQQLRYDIITPFPSFPFVLPIFLLLPFNCLAIASVMVLYREIMMGVLWWPRAVVDLRLWTINVMNPYVRMILNQEWKWEVSLSLSRPQCLIFLAIIHRYILNLFIQRNLEYRGRYSLQRRLLN